MQNVAYRLSDAQLIRTAIALILIAGVGLAGLVGYYHWERQSQPRASLMEKMAQQMEDRVRADPQNVVLRLNLANAYLQAGLQDAALEQFQQALILEENHIGALLGLGTTYMQKGQKSEAIKYFTQVVEVTRGAEMVHLDRRVTTAHYYLGKIYLENNQLDEASRELTEALAGQRSNADILNLLAVVSQKRGNHSEAVDYFTRALRFDPAFVEAYGGLVVSYRALGDGQRASYAEAMASLFSGQVDAAIAKLESLVISVDDADAYWGLGWAYETKGQTDKALAAYQSALDANPLHPLASASISRLKGGR